MTPEEWQRVRPILESALELEQESRADFVARACAGDEGLRQEVQSLFIQHAQADGRLEQPALEMVCQHIAEDEQQRDNEVGSALLGCMVSHYRVVEKLGGGGMGVVYRAEDTRLGRQVALKFLPQEMAREEQALERFKLEARAASALNHPHICTVHDIGEYDGGPFMVMELLTGSTLKYRISGQSLPVDSVVELGSQIANGLQAAHARGILHRDIKPANIFVTDSGQAKILDFGLAKMAEAGHTASTSEPNKLAGAAAAPVRAPEITVAGTLMGTAPYMSPEQARGERVDARSDIFSLGAVLYEMATGQPAFPGATTAEIREAVLTREPVSARQLNRKIPSAIERAINKTLRKKPEDRYQCAGDVAAGLLRVRPAVASRPWLSYRVALTILALATALALVPRLRFQSAPPFTSLLLTEVDNRTGKAVFNDTLNQVLAIKLRESPYMEIVSPDRIRDMLRPAGHGSEHPSRSQIQEICRNIARTKGMLLSSITVAGNHYALRLEAVDCETGASLARVQSEAAGEEGVVTAMGAAIGSLRAKLGEPPASIQRFDAPADQATSSSLAALQAFSLGELKRAKGEQVEAAPFYLSAIESDPKFALACGRLGTIYRNSGELNRAVEFQRRAFDLRARASEPERLYITAHFYQDVTGEVDKAIATYQVWAQTYPREWTPHNNLAVMYLELGQFEKAADEGREAVRLNADNVLSYNNLASAYLRLNRFNEAKATFEAALTRGLNSSSIHRGLYAIAVVYSDVAGMQREVEWAEDKSEGYRMLADEAAVAASEGHLRASRDLTSRAIDGALRSGLKGPATWIVGRQALSEAAYGNRNQAHFWVAKALAITQSQDALAQGALALALVGDSKGAKLLSAKLNSNFQSDTWIQHALLPTVDAAVLAQRNPPRSVEALDQVKPYASGLRSGFFPTYIRGLAFLREQRAEKAAAEFQSILDHRGVDPISPLYAIARLGLARSYSLARNTEAARKLYEQVFDQWKSADEDLAIVPQARAEAAVLDGRPRPPSNP